MEIKKTIGVRELAQRLGICRNTAYALAAKSDFYPAFKVGKKVCIDVDLLEGWINEQGREKRNAACNDS